MTRTITEEPLLMQAMAHFNANRLEQARMVCEQVLAREPANGECLFLLGSIHLRGGDVSLACELYLQAADADPDSLTGQLATGFYFRLSDKLPEAVACFRQATALAPKDPTAWTLLGETLATLGNERFTRQSRSAEVQECIRRLEQITADAMKPQIKSAKRSSTRKSSARQQSTARQESNVQPQLVELLRFAEELFKQQRNGEALGAYRQALALQPDCAEALHGAALCLFQLDQNDEAVTFLKQVIELSPARTKAQHDLVQVLLEQGDHGQAEICAGALVQNNPRSAPAYVDLGRTLSVQRRFREAAACYHKALELDPGNPWAYVCLGISMLNEGEIEKATLYCRKALELRPSLTHIRASMGALLLQQGDYEQGWEYCEARLKLPEFATLRASRPRWDGSSLVGKTILVLAEQGIGDSIQFVRYLPLLKARGARIKFMGPQPVQTLFASLGCIDEWLDASSVMTTGVDTYSLLMSLPGMLGTTLENIPSDVPYLTPGAELCGRWREQLASYKGYKVGIVWAGNPNFKADRERSCPLSAFLPLFDIPGITLFSLQKGERATAKLATLPPDKKLVDLAGQFHNYEETAAAILNLDLVISVDTSVAHLTGALAHPVWTLLPWASDWRWLLHREDTPWYPTMHLFRQPSPGDWEAVLRNVATALATEAAATDSGRQKALKSHALLEPERFVPERCYL